MTKKIYESILFDMGNVLIDFDPRAIVSAFCDDKLTIELLTEEIFLKSEWVNLDRGSISENEAEASFCLRLPKSMHPLVHTIFLEWPKTVIVREEMIPLVKLLKSKGYQLYLASNASIRFYEYKDKIKALDEFNGVLISAEIHQIKPDSAFYLSLMSRFDLEPESCFMIDDRKENIEAAASIGIDGTVYDGSIEHLILTLIAKGIL
jgi:putative hydrolase of the HAD superfamily